MPKKLMMNNVNDDVIVLCKDFSPNGQPFVLLENEKIDWDKYELYMNVDLTEAKREWESVLIISTDNVTAWAGFKLHLYVSPMYFRIDTGENYFYKNIDIDNYDKKHLEVVVNKNGVYLSDKLILNKNSHGNTIKTWDLLTTKPLTIGSAILEDKGNFTYHLIQLQPYQERGEYYVC